MFKIINERSESRGYIRVLYFYLVLFFLLVQCRTGYKIYGPDDFENLPDIKKFEYEYSLHEGIKYRILDDYPLAVYFFGQCIDIFPFSDVAFFELSKIYLNAGQIEQSIYHAKRALEIDSLNLWYYNHLASVYVQNEDIKSAIQVYQKASYLYESEIDLLFMIASLYLREEMFDQALNVFDRIEKIIGIDERVAISRQNIFMKRGEFEKAYNEISSLISEYPLEARYYGILAELYASLDMEKEAMENYQKLFKLDPENGMAQLSVAEFFINRGKFEEAFYYLIAAFKNPGIDYQEKVMVLSGFVSDRSLSDNFPYKIEQLGELLIEEFPDRENGKLLMIDFYTNTGSFNRAYEILYDLYSMHPDNVFFAEQLMAIAGYDEDFGKVINFGEKAIELFPESYMIHYFLGVAYHVENKVDLALDLFERAVGIEEIEEEFKGHVLSYLGDLYYQAGDHSKSDHFFEEAIKIDGNNFITLNNFSYYLALRNERLDEALAFSFKTIVKEPENSSFLDTYAWILYKLGRYNESLKYIELAYSHNGSESYEIVKHYGQILIKLKRYEEAVYFLNKAYLLTEDSEEIERILSVIEENIEN